MKRYLISLITLVCSVVGANAMDYETAREQAYYLTDKMAYELNLNEQQYNDAYEINLDYLLSLNTESDILSSYLEYRNADLRYILYDWQWNAFLAADYFLRPIGWISGGWYFPVYSHYAHGYFFYDRPGIFWNYRGAHCHAHYMQRSFYADRRPMWNGGFRGADRGMIGHPNGRSGGRYGTPGGGRGSVGRQGDMRGGNNRGGANPNGRPNGTSNRGGNVNTRSNGAGERMNGGATNRNSNVGGMRSSSRTTSGAGVNRSTQTPSRNTGNMNRSTSTSRPSVSTPTRGSEVRSNSGATRSSGGGSGVSRSSGSTRSSGGGHSSGGSRGGGGGGRR